MKLGILWFYPTPAFGQTEEELASATETIKIFEDGSGYPSFPCFQDVAAVLALDIS
jgi:hypothetical protein